MIKYQVHYSVGRPKGLKHGVRTVKARNERDAITMIRKMIDGSFGHWVNRLANEVA